MSDWTPSDPKRLKDALQVAAEELDRLHGELCDRMQSGTRMVEADRDALRAMVARYCPPR